MIERIPNAGSVGVVKDLSQHELPINAWSDASNIRFLDGYANQFYGHSSVYGTPTVTPYHVVPVNIGTSRYWLYAGGAKIYCVINTGGVPVHTNLTRQTAGVDVDYTGATNAWTSTSLSGIPILNAGNVTDPPQQWDLDTSHKFTALSNWPASTYCKSMRAYKNYLVALNVTKSGTNYTYMVKWSHPADPGGVPSSWDQTDATKDAGEYDLAEGGDPIVDGLQLRDSFMIYKESSVWRMDYTGGPFVMRFQKMLGLSGAMNRNCIVEVDGRHFVLTNNDVVVHDGQTETPVLDKIARRSLFLDMDANYTSKAFVFKNPFFNEVYVCYASLGNTVPNKAMVWNYKDNTVSYRTIPNLNHANLGTIDDSLTGAWSLDTETWDQDLSMWDGAGVTFAPSSVLLASNDTHLYKLDDGTLFAGVTASSYLERRGLSFGAPERVKLIKSIRARITGSVGSTVLVKVGYQADPWADPVYTTMTHTIGSTVSNDCLVASRYHSIMFASGTANVWRLDSYDVEIEDQGAW